MDESMQKKMKDVKEKLSKAARQLRRSFAFTLAEVLITLGVIGVIAAITIPNVIKNYQKHITVNQLKKAYNTLSNTMLKSNIDNGDFMTWDLSNQSKVLEKYFIPYLKGAKKLKSHYNVTTLGTNTTYYFWSSNINTQPIYQLNNGMTFTYSERNKGEYVITVDLNGPKKPNMLGKDGFVFGIQPQINNGTIRVKGYTLTRQQAIKDEPYSPCNLNKGGNLYRGAVCGRLIELDGWKIEKDYPW